MMFITMTRWLAIAALLLAPLALLAEEHGTEAAEAQAAAEKTEASAPAQAEEAGDEPGEQAARAEKKTRAKPATEQAETEPGEQPARAEKGTRPEATAEAQERPTRASAPAADVETIGRAQFTTEVQEREPVDEIEQVPAGAERVVFFTELRGLEGREVIHKWTLNGHPGVVREMNVGGPRWRAWSIHPVTEELEGTFQVEVLDDTGASHGTWTVELASN